MATSSRDIPIWKDDSQRQGPIEPRLFHWSHVDHKEGDAENPRLLPELTSGQHAVRLFLSENQELARMIASGQPSKSILRELAKGLARKLRWEWLLISQRRSGWQEVTRGTADPLQLRGLGTSLHKYPPRCDRVEYRQLKIDGAGETILEHPEEAPSPTSLRETSDEANRVQSIPSCNCAMLSIGPQSASRGLLVFIGRTPRTLTISEVAQIDVTVLIVELVAQLLGERTL